MLFSASASAAAVCLIACHGGPADHFATFAESLSRDVGDIEVYASGPALKKFQERGIEVKVPFSIDKVSPEEEDALAEQIAKACSTASVIITDVGHAFDIKVQKALARQAIHVPRFAYYDNPESYVPGGYSAVAAEVMLVANGILFANSNLAKASIFQEPGKEIDFGGRERVGIGYYPIYQAEKIAKRRASEQLSMRQTLFSRNNLVDTGQKVLVYFGGNNEEYFSKAFPAFLSLLEAGMKQSDFSNYLLSNKDYTVYNALTWANCFNHARRIWTPPASYSQRIFHGTVALIELIPIVSQIASLFEMAVASLFKPSTVLTDLVIVIQQHPGAKSKNIDGNMVSSWIGKHSATREAPRVILSDFSSDDAQTIADGALYYQTSMGPQFVLAGIPTIQVGHETFEDILVRNQLSPSVTDVNQLISVVDGLTHQKKEIPQEVIFEGLGIKPNWLLTLEKAIKGNAEAVSKQRVSL